MVAAPLRLALPLASSMASHQLLLPLPFRCLPLKPLSPQLLYEALP